MDPTECLLKILRAFSEKDPNTAFDALTDLSDLLLKEGSMPDVPRALWEILKEPSSTPGLEYFETLGEEELANQEIMQKAACIVTSFKDALNRGHKHFNKNGQELKTVLEILRTLQKEGSVVVI